MTAQVEIAFTKMHGLGNDFVLIDDRSEELSLTAEEIARVCDRHFGVGADGLILVRPPSSADADFFMAYHNADGSPAEMCGNGIRCFAKFVVDRGIVPPDADGVRVETLGGVKPITFTRDEEGRMHMATVDMGVPVLDPPRIPTTLLGTQIFECPLATPLGEFRVTAVSMGNPHAVVWVDDVSSAPVGTVGPAIETHEAFPNKTNVEFAEYRGGETIAVRVWERGVGETLACGTGACAVLVAATLKCLVGRSATIELPGGALHCRWDEDEHLYMTGPATTVFTATLQTDDVDAGCV